MKKVTFTLDDATTAAIREYAEIDGKAQSAIVREAVVAYGKARDRLAPAEQARMLAAIEEYRRYLASQPRRSRKAVERELAEIRESRRHMFDRRDRAARRRR